MEKVKLNIDELGQKNKTLQITSEKLKQFEDAIRVRDMFSKLFAKAEKSPCTLSKDRKVVRLETDRWNNQILCMARMDE